MLPVLDGQGPLHDQLYRWLRESILSGHVGAGERLPSSRSLARSQSLSRNTVLRAYERLVAEGYLSAKPGGGTFVAKGVRAATRAVHVDSNGVMDVRLSPVALRALESVPARYLANNPEGYRDTAAADADFQYGEPRADPITWRSWRRHLARRAADMPSTYPPARGLARLRHAIADFLWRRRGMRVDAGQIVIVSGAQQALDLVARVLLAPGERVLVENPGYPGARAAFAASGASVTPCPVDKEGLVTDGLSAARLVYTTPSHQFPTGAVLPLGRRAALLAWAHTHNAFVLEDDYDSDYVHLRRPLEAVHALDRHERVIYAGTFAKVLSPALRLGYMVLPGALVDAVCAVKSLSDRGSPMVEQATLADFIESGELDRHIRRTARHLHQCRDALVGGLGEELGEAVRLTGTHAGMHLAAWLRELPPSRLPSLCAAAARRGARIYPLTRYYHAGGPDVAALLLGYATLSPGRIARGVECIGAAYKECRRR